MWAFLTFVVASARFSFLRSDFARVFSARALRFLLLDFSVFVSAARVSWLAPRIH
jgi:hypothetical protein